MGEAKRRGTFEQRKATAKGIRNKPLPKGHDIAGWFYEIRQKKLASGKIVNVGFRRTQ